MYVCRTSAWTCKCIFFVQMYLLDSTPNYATISQRFCKCLINRMMKEGCKRSCERFIINLYGCHFNVFHKYNTNALEYVDLLLDQSPDDVIYSFIISDWTVYRTYPLKTLPLLLILP